MGASTSVERVGLKATENGYNFRMARGLAITIDVDKEEEYCCGSCRSGAVVVVVVVVVVARSGKGAEDYYQSICGG